MTRPRILIVVDSYRPGYLAGGPIRSIANIVDTLGVDFDFRVLTRNRDHGTETAYDSVEPDTWFEREGESVYYSSARRITAHLINSCARSIDADLVYLNSLFSSSSRSFLGSTRVRGSAAPVLLAPRGQLDAGAMGIHYRRKRGFLKAAQLTGLLSGIAWHATNVGERLSILQIAGQRADVVLAPNIPRQPDATISDPPPKTVGSARFLFLSRISPKKNLPFLFEVLSTLSGEVHLTLAGPRDPGYLDNLPDLLARLPPSVTVDVVGALDHSSTDAAIAEHHALVLPTLGENFGHAIWESIRMGRPVLISDKTPWKPTHEAGFGWAIPLNDREAWADRLVNIIALDQCEYARLVSSTFKFAQQWHDNSPASEAHALMFSDALRSTRTGAR